MLKWVVVIAAIAIVSGEDGAGSKLVETSQGPVRGYKTSDGNIFAFHGIPYATAPIGVNKFKAPLPPPQWSLPFEAKNRNVICPQVQYFFNLENKTQQEDCLIANVYLPDTDETNLPVVVYVHGGAYHIGYGDMLTAKQLMANRDMIVINFNYRLGVHGFLCLGTEDVPGNAGMKDQIALLRWVNKNIASFGGNPNDVTLIGYSAGSSSVDLLLLSPLAKGLFNKVIPESGASMSPFSVQSDPLENGWKFAETLNFRSSDNDVYALERFYKTISFDKMFFVNFLNITDSTFYFSPCVERDIGQEMFLEEAPINLLKKGKNMKVPMLFGFSEMEGLFRLPLFEDWKDLMNKKFSDFLPADLKFPNDQVRETIAQKVKEFYFGDKLINEGTILRYIDYFTDVIFAYGTLKSVELQVMSGNEEVYLYEYSFVDINTPHVPHTQVRGANHCAQSLAVADGFEMFNSTNKSDDLKKMENLMRNIWSNFIVNGKPVPSDSSIPSWPSVDANGGPHMSLDQTIKLKGPLIQQRKLFWDSIYEKYYRVPVPPAPSRVKSEL